MALKDIINNLFGNIREEYKVAYQDSIQQGNITPLMSFFEKNKSILEEKGIEFKDVLDSSLNQELPQGNSENTQQNTQQNSENNSNLDENIKENEKPQDEGNSPNIFLNYFFPVIAVAGVGYWLYYVVKRNS